MSVPTTLALSPPERYAAEMITTDTILTGDCLTILPTLPAGIATLAYLDPPFNIGLEYPGYDDRRPRGEYLAWLEDVFRQTIRVLTPTGSLWVQCGPTIQAEVKVMLEALDLHHRQTVIWHYTFGPCQSRKFTPSWQALHWFTRDPERFTFNADAVRVPSARQTKYNDRRANPKGKLPDDVWIIPRVCGTFGERIKGHGCQTPEKVLERVVLACSNPGEVVLDCLAGTGTTPAVAKRLGRRYLAIELWEETAAKARQRIEDTGEGGTSA